jgi:hypothetical protein
VGESNSETSERGRLRSRADGYIIEGHIPARAIQRLLAESPAAAGLAVPGMPIGSPGMEAPGAVNETYDVMLFGPWGKRSYARFEGSREL